MRQIKRLLPVFLVFAIALCMALAVACTKEYTVTFDSDGGSAVASQTVNNGQKAEKPEDPTKSFQEFVGWYYGDAEYDFETPVTADITLTAKWANLYSAQFDSVGGSAVASQVVREGGKVEKPTDPTKTGYGFDGWYLGETAYDFNTVVTGDVKLFAHWTLNVYDVTFNSDGGTEFEAIKVDHGSKITLPTPVKWGYDFAGWYNGDNLVESGAVTGNLALTAHWTAWEVWTDENKTQLTDIIINTDGVKKAYNVGEQLDTDGLKVRLVSVNEEGTTFNFEVAEEDITAKVAVDSSEFNSNREGTYTVYVSYTHDGITRHTSYEVTVTSVISGIHGIIMEKEVTDYDIAVDAAPETIPVEDIKVYMANEDGTKGDEITEGVTYEYYLGNKKIALSDLTNQNARVYQIWANVNYTVGTETYVMSNFVLVRVNGNNITKMQFVPEGATTSQAQGYSDLMSGTWKFNVEYRLGQTGVIDLSTAESGTGNNQYTLSNFSPATIGANIATLTYHYAVGTEIWEYSAEVPYSVYPVSVSETISKLVDVKNKNDDATGTPEYDYQITKDLADGDEIIPFMAYAYGTQGLATNNENKYDNAADKTNRLYGRVQLNNSSRGIKVYLAGPTTLTFMARFGSSSGEGAKFQIKDADSLSLVAESGLVSKTGEYETVTATVNKAGVYVILSSTGSLNLFRFSINVSILGPTVSLNANDVAVTDGDSTTSVTLSEHFTLVAKSGKAVAVSECEPVVIGGKTFTKQINLKGAGGKDNRHVAFAIPEIKGSASVIVYAGHGGGADAERKLELCKADGTAVASAQVAGAGSVVQFEVTEAGNYYVRSASSGQLIYYIGLTYQIQEAA